MSIDKSNKYDRQLRLWASSGQSNLESSHICVVNATTTASEILKNLVLPGVGNFTIIDDKNVSEQDISSNFFLTGEELGQNRAVALVKWLQELNEDTRGHSIQDSLEKVLSRPSEFWDAFNTVVVSEHVPQASLTQLRSILFTKHIPLLIVRTAGFYGTINLVVDEVTVMETHTNSKLSDLRIDCPWTELAEYADSIDLDALDDTDHAHIPYVIIFIKALQQWKLQTGSHPKDYKQKKEFKKLIESMSRNINFETNFIEAFNSVHRALQETKVPSFLYNLFESDKIKDDSINLSTPVFWILVKALANFVHVHAKLPLSGSLPDMASNTTNYIKLQSIYKKKANQDKEAFIGEVMKILDSIGRSQDDVNLDLITIFCKNCQFLHVATGNNELFNDALLSKLVSGDAGDLDNAQYNMLAIYHGLFANDLFIETFHRPPTASDLHSFIQLFTKTFGLTSDLPQSVVNTFQEIVSHNTRHYHNISSLLGGIASQEVLKLTTTQYIPLDNLFIFDGIRSVSDKVKI